MSYNQYIKQPMQKLEIKLNMIIAKKPHLINSLDRSNINRLLRNISHSPFIIQ